MNFNGTKRALVITFFFFSFPAFAAPDQASDSVDKFIQSEMQREKIPGLSIAVIQNNKIIKAKGYGLANIELNVPAAPDTVYQLGSVGKQFTATLIMKLVEQGKIKLEDKISQYLKNTPANWKDITIRNLLTHTGGIREYTAAGVGEHSDINVRLDYTDAQLLQHIESYPLNSPPGEKWSYSDTEYVLLGMVIKSVTGKFYGDLLQEYIFQPLGMKATRIINEADIVPNRAAGYWLVKGEIKNQEYVSPTLNTTADGSIYSTVLDMAKWDMALYTDKILKQTNLKLMWRPVNVKGKAYPYGFGWRLDNINGHRIVYHDGWWQGFTSFILRDIDGKLTVIVLANLADANTKLIALHVAGIYNSQLISKYPPALQY